MIKQYVEMAGFTEDDVKVYSMLKDDASKKYSEITGTLVPLV